MVKERNQKTINLTAVEPIRHGDTSKAAPSEWLKGMQQPFLDPQVFLVPGNLRYATLHVLNIKMHLSHSSNKKTHTPNLFIYITRCPNCYCKLNTLLSICVMCSLNNYK